MKKNGKNGKRLEAMNRLIRDNIEKFAMLRGEFREQMDKIKAALKQIRKKLNQWMNKKNR